MDSFEFEVTDGFNPVYRTFRISISDVDNKKPIVTINTLRIKEGSTKLISPFELKGKLVIEVTASQLIETFIIEKNWFICKQLKFLGIVIQVNLF